MSDSVARASTRSLDMDRLNRALLTQNECARALLRATNEAALLRDVCQIVAEKGRHLGVTISLAASLRKSEGHERVVTYAAGDMNAAGSIVRIPLADGSEHFGTLTVNASREEPLHDQEVMILSAIGADLALTIRTLRKGAENLQADERLHRREQGFRAFVENSPDLILRFDREHRQTYINPAVCRTFGMPASSFLNRPIGSATAAAGLEGNPKVIKEIEESIRCVFATGAPVELEAPWPTPGGVRIFSIQIFPEHDQTGAVISALAIARDITERRSIERSFQNVLRHARTMVMRAVVIAPDGWEQHGVEWAAAHFRWNSTFEDEVSAQHVLPLNVLPGQGYNDAWNQAKHGEDQGRMGLLAHRVFISGERSWQQQFRCTDRHGQLHWFAQVASVEPVAHGRWHVVTINTDITEQKRAEGVVLEREGEFRALAENIPDFILRWDQQLQCVYANPAFARAMGMPAGQVVGARFDRTDSIFLESESAGSNAAIAAAIRQVITTSEPAEILIPWSTVTEERFVYMRLIPEFSTDGTLATVLGIGRDITALKDTEEQLRALTDNSPDLIARVARDYRYLYINRAIESLSGRSAAYYIGKQVGEASAVGEPGVSLAQINVIREAIDRVFASANPTELEERIRFERGEIYLNGRFIPEFNQAGEVVSVLIIARDITERKRAEEALRQSQQAYASLVTSIDGIVWEADAQTFQFTFVSPQATRLLGYSTEEWIRDPNFWSDHLHPEDREQTVSYCVNATRAMHDHDFKYRMIGANGRPVWLHDLVTVIVEDGRPVKLRGIMLDITKAKRAEEALALFRTLIDHTTDGIQVIDPVTGRFLDVNDTACRVHGFSREEFLSLHITDIERKAADAQADAWHKNVDQIRHSGSRISEGEHCRKDGSTFPVEVNASYVSAGRDYIVAIVRDITERRRVEAALRESENRFRQVTETIDEVFWLTDISKSEMIYISPAYEKVWGRTCASLYAAPRSWLEAIHADDQDRVTAALSRQAAGSYDVEYRIVRPDGVVRWIHDRAFPIRDAHGKIYRLAGVAEDTTARRELEEQFRQAQKMEAVGQLAGGIAHDFNNLLTVVQMQTSLLLDDKRLDAETEQGVRQIMDAATRAANLTRQLLAFSRQHVKQAQPLELSGVITATTKLLRRVLGEHISLESRFASGLPLIHADPSMMEQVLMNLVINARDAMPDGGRLLIALEQVHLDSADVPLHPSARTGRFVRLSVKDTGCGIPDDVLPRIFEPFFTTKEVGKGTGLGLATVFGIVQHHHGWIEIESEVGHGSTFRVFLPAIDGSVQAASACPTATSRGGSETILLVEDEPGVQSVATRALERRGYRVLTAGSAAEAFRVWDAHDGRIDLLLTDLIMPGGVSGQKLAAELRARWPGLKIIYTSGYRGDTVTHGIKFETGRNFLPKPYPLDDLVTIVRQRLDES